MNTRTKIKGIMRILGILHKDLGQDFEGRARERGEVGVN